MIKQSTNTLFDSGIATTLRQQCILFLRKPFVLFCITGTIAFSILLSIYTANANRILEWLLHEQTLDLELTESSILFDFDRVLSDLAYIQDSPSMKDYLNDPNTYKADVEQNWLSLMLATGLYDQIRFIDTEGSERIRVNYNEGCVEVVPPEELQYKHDRYYFTKAMALPPGEVYVSPLDLNFENGIIDIPYNPMMRFAVGMTNDQGVHQGVLVLNYLASRIFDNIPFTSIEVLNQDGFWLHSIDPEREWGFMFENEMSMATLYPKVWQEAATQTYSQIHLPEGITLTHRVVPFPSAKRSWVLVSTLTSAEMNQALITVRNLYIMISLLVCGVILLTLFLMEKILESIRNRQEKLRLEGALSTVGTICHEFNQPLTIIHGYASILQSQPHEVRQEKYIQSINESSLRMSQIMERLRSVTSYETVSYSDNSQILDLSSSEAGQTKKPPTEAGGFSNSGSHVLPSAVTNQ